MFAYHKRPYTSESPTAVYIPVCCVYVSVFLHLQLEFRLGFKANVILRFRSLGTQSANDGPHKD